MDYEYMAHSCLFKGKPDLPTDKCKIILLCNIKTNNLNMIVIGLVDEMGTIRPIKLDTFTERHVYMGFRDEYLFYKVDNIDNSYKWLVLSEIVYTCNYNGIPVCDELVQFARNNPELFVLINEDTAIQSPMIWYSDNKPPNLSSIWGPYETFNNAYEDGFHRIAVTGESDPVVEDGAILIAQSRPTDYYNLTTQLN